MRIVWTASVLLVLGCTDRATVANGDDGGDPVMRPDAGPWSVCESQPECADVEFCVFPMDESGFCTEACAGGNAGGCPPAYAGSIEPSCVDVGGNNVVCALECSGGKQCPVGMICEAVELPDGARKLCF